MRIICLSGATPVTVGLGQDMKFKAVGLKLHIINKRLEVCLVWSASQLMLRIWGLSSSGGMYLWTCRQLVSYVMAA